MNGITAQLFLSTFGVQPTVFASAPGRVNLMGDHTDYNEGFVLPTALHWETEIVAAESGSHRSEFFSFDSKARIACSLHEDEAEGFARYIVAVARELTNLGWELPEVGVLVRSNVPIGAGLASSAALVVASATMFEKLAGKSLSPIEKAKLCQRAEHRCGTPCGIMDMFTATHAKRDCALLLDCRSLEFKHIKLPADLTIFIVNTNVQHELANGAYADRRACCEGAARKLGKPALRDASEGELETYKGQLDEVEFRRARHVVTENARTLRAAEALEAGDLDAFGRTMFESHDSLASDFEVSCAELDAVVALVKANRPALGYGARMTGAGFGGCAIVACLEEHASDIRQILFKLLAPTLGRNVSINRV